MSRRGVLGAAHACTGWIVERGASIGFLLIWNTVSNAQCKGCTVTRLMLRTEQASARGDLCVLGWGSLSVGIRVDKYVFSLNEDI